MAGWMTLATLFGCSAHQRGAVTSPTADATAASNKQFSKDLRRAVAEGDLQQAGAVVDAARQAPAGARPKPELIAYFDATVHAYRGDFRAAAVALSGHLATVPQSDRATFRFHNALILLRLAEGDLLGAIAECEEMTKAGERGDWGATDAERLGEVRLKEHWHRAYLWRMAAATRVGPERDALLRYAERSRQEFAAIATPQKLDDSIAVLEAYFAYCDGDKEAMLRAARRVNVAENDDLEDLYLTQVALEEGGDVAAADAVRTRMRSLESATLVVPIFMRWLRTDEAAAKGEPPRFSAKLHSAPAR